MTGIHPVEMTYNTVPTLKEIIEKTSGYYNNLSSGLTPHDWQVLIALDTRATLRIVEYRAALSEHFERLEAAPTPEAEEWLHTQPPRYNWMRLTTEEISKLRQFSSMGIMSNSALDTSTLSPSTKLKGNLVLDHTRRILNHYCGK